MLTFNGTHGTTELRANDICLNGFKPTEVGRAGFGVYFWRFQNQHEIATDLARGWFDAQKAHYGETDPKCAIIYGSIKILEDDRLEFDHALLEELGLILRAIGAFSEDDIHSAYEVVIARIEKLTSRTFTVITSCVSVPRRMSFSIKSVIGNPQIFVVRKQFELIKTTLIAP